MTEALSCDSTSHRVFRAGRSSEDVNPRLLIHQSIRPSVHLTRLLPIDETSIWLFPCSKPNYRFSLLHVLFLFSPKETLSSPRLTFSHFQPRPKKKKEENKTSGRPSELGSASIHRPSITCLEHYRTGRRL